MLAAVIMAYYYYDVKEMKDLFQQIYLRLYGSSIYEYHALTGKRPAKIDDLARTSLPVYLMLQPGFGLGLFKVFGVSLNPKPTPTAWTTRRRWLRVG